MHMKEGDSNPIANYDYYRMCFGDPAKLPESDNNPEYLLKKQLAAGKKLPQIWYEWEFGKKEAPAGKHEIH